MMQMMQQMSSGLSQVTFVWLQVALFAALVAVRVWKPDRIGSQTAFRWSGSCLALSIILPPFLTALMNNLVLGQTGSFSPSNSMMIVLAVPSIIPGLFVGMGVYLLLAALTFGPPAPRPQAAPKPHPLD